jgi:hypothetical protein
MESASRHPMKALTFWLCINTKNLHSCTNNDNKCFAGMFVLANDYVVQVRYVGEFLHLQLKWVVKSRVNFPVVVL